MMFVTVAAILCHMLANVPSPVCEEVIVTDSALTEGLTFIGCVSGGQAPIALWKSEHPIYRSDKYWISKYRCAPGHYEVGGRA